mmetsp:Transcript_37642/g.111309  ORF Transcript_37642/g.111309 Transcript_37642/m.111309 type:complete len:287 (-) Transcript_37642:3327-4187(-)
MGKDRPELTGPPDLFYNEDEALKYTNNSRMIEIQSKLSERAVELLCLPDDGTPRMLLDIGCGSGLSGEQLTEMGHMWVGLDISPAMLDVAVEREVDGDVCLHDMGHGLPLRPGTFDGAISISAVQWLCNADCSAHDPRRRLKRFFETLYSALRRGARAVLQVYPQNAAQAEMMVAAAMKVGFSGGLVVDFPHSTRAKKYFLVLMVGTSVAMPKAKDGDPDKDDRPQEVSVSARQNGASKRRKGSGGQPQGKGRSWVFRKKEQMRNRGYDDIPTDTKYTGRKRKARF